MTAVAIVPALNERAAIPGLVELGGLLDGAGCDLVIADGGSTDGTEAAAKAADLTVWSTVDPALGPVLGKGDNVVRALRRLGPSVERVMLIDADVVLDEPHRWLTLLASVDERQPFVKSAFVRDRSEHDSGSQQLPGGRLTDLVARPLLRQTHPRLAELSQPLSGQVAFLRTIVDELAWYSHYGLEIGMLVSAAGHFGEVPEVDLGVLRHRARSDTALAAAAQDVVDAYHACVAGPLRPASRLRHLSPT